VEEFKGECECSVVRLGYLRLISIEFIVEKYSLPAFCKNFFQNKKKLNS
jgi:hypothetical protein